MKKKPSVLLAPLTNRESEGSGFVMPADGWFHLAPLGDFYVQAVMDEATGKNAFGTDAPWIVQRIDDKAVKAMADGFANELLVDFEHFSHETDKSSEAAGWIQELQARPEGLFMRCRWSDAGEAALKGGRYRYISPVWFPNDCELIEFAEDGKTPIVRPLRLSDAGLTNNPNLRGLTPLSNRAGGVPAAIQNQTTNDRMKLTEATIIAMLAALGLPPEATDEQVKTALESAIKNMQAGKECEALKNELAEVKGQLAEQDLDNMGIEDEKTREEAKPLLMTNRAGALALLGGRAAGSHVRQPLTNRKAAMTPGQKPAKAPLANRAADQNALVAAIRNREKCDFNTAWTLARQEKPELFVEE